MPGTAGEKKVSGPVVLMGSSRREEYMRGQCYSGEPGSLLPGMLIVYASGWFAWRACWLMGSPRIFPKGHSPHRVATIGGNSRER